jgi:hypothetical protein
MISRNDFKALVPEHSQKNQNKRAGALSRGEHHRTSSQHHCHRSIYLDFTVRFNYRIDVQARAHSGPHELLLLARACWHCPNWTFIQTKLSSQLLERNSDLEHSPRLLRIQTFPEMLFRGLTPFNHLPNPLRVNLNPLAALSNTGGWICASNSPDCQILAGGRDSRPNRCTPYRALAIECLKSCSSKNAE